MEQDVAQGADSALVQLGWTWDSVTQISGNKLTTIDLADPAHPAVSEMSLPARKDGGYYSLVGDAADPSGFYVTYADTVGQRVDNGFTFYRTRHYAERFHRAVAGASAGAWQGEGSINLPGQLARAWAPVPGEKAMLTTDTVNYTTKDAQGIVSWRFDTRLNLLRVATPSRGKPVAELMASRQFSGQYVSDFVTEGSSLFVNVGSGSYGYYGPVGSSVGAKLADVAPTASGAVRRAALVAAPADDASDRLMIFDVSRLAFDVLYDQPTGTNGAQFMGTYHHQLFVNLQGDGLFAVDVTDPAHPVSRDFLRTLGWGTNVAFVGDSAYVASGYFGTYQMPLH